ncbi:MAG: amidinotransferase [Deltaproteobacteria bacterium RIFCSPLOWO2_12_FULL_44_12]|nr:MAG: amidinotransferase [Deltaproteobacteria bacterium RIFCSPHIGHO2_01_FULL_43_49]OGQ15545.1 MAG: amidinotransferase [Deltaproteobacteria bacterium RIFCSPHIGHO2_02_FULL_44_53]OGQ28487.1 MAG: amidinotransferase [Deltaproteobacteria bacterium RIFCSPHIGHO2_12_FULL_44_21]OGQ32351.1 MAG: amidinotransferase [Deltaproteobacteria bacterium RIFCSPLOWO2_01_FULL_45_74]OGQ43993.1 MAG: amidinotransferase [Deltaproteobacteria bacterium RIFCSPLOWO2_02_FULL_44_34]OGQ71048.1 MAG: amidinotransferase [Deltapr
MYTSPGLTLGGSLSSASSAGTLGSYNEWDPLREAIVGRVEGATVPDESFQMIQATLPKGYWQFFRDRAGSPFPQDVLDAAKKDLDAFVHILESEGVKVRRPKDPGDLFHKPIEKEGWKTKGGFYAAMPRDALLVVGDEIIAAPMAWRSRYREHEPYQELLGAYQQRGFRYTVAPRPELTDRSYNKNWRYKEDQFESVITEEEPLFDAADFIRLGADIVVQQSHVTNRMGIDWLQTHLGSRYRIHVLQFDDSHPMHIDATFMPLKPGLVLVNPERVSETVVQNLINGLFLGWDFVFAPKPIIPDTQPLYMTSKWLNMNVLMLDQNRVIVEAEDEPMVQSMKYLGLQPIRCPFRNFYSLGGAFHCATLDVHREGVLESLLNRE